MHVAVIGHTDRESQARSLAASLDATLYLDDGSLGEWANHRRALEAGTDSSHLLLLQDDALPVPSFLDAAQQAIKERPDSLISFYLGTTRPQANLVQSAVDRAIRNDARWIEHNTLWWGVAIAIPATDLPALLSFCDTRDEPYDFRIGAFYRTSRRPVLYTWPSLVDHDDGPSLVGHFTRRPRKAHRTGIPTGSGTVRI